MIATDSPTTAPPDTEIVPGLTELRRLGDLIEQRRLPCGVEKDGDLLNDVVLRPWSWEDEGWLGEVQGAPGMTPGLFLRAAIGWLTETLAGVEMRRSDGEVSSPLRPTEARALRNAAVGRLPYGDLITVLMMIRAVSDPEITLPVRVDGLDGRIPVRFSLLDAPVRCLVEGRRPSELHVELGGATWAPPGIRLFDLLAGNQGRLSSIKMRRQMLETAHRSGVPLREVPRQLHAEIIEQVERRTCGARLKIGTIYEGRRVEGIVPLGQLFRF